MCGNETTEQNDNSPKTHTLRVRYNLENETDIDICENCLPTFTKNCLKLVNNFGTEGNYLCKCLGIHLDTYY